ncbi:MFS transporter [Acuticoccus sp. M5D2P5]|uniref:MFS transporter n=1 Tax=Acuticoccus kalidii TaxID=2910977 RepID=UPI001F2CECA4|nr:MFS transporter [Acuticoccus kalidii]MCF3934215.1 MFS transporter [Acuticoccus kalidii]
MTTGSVSMRAALAPVSALLIGVGLLYLGFGLQSTLVPLRADVEGFNRLSIGLLGSTYYAGFVAGCLFAPFVILRAGHIRAFAAMVSLVSAAALAFPLIIGEIEWIIFRFAIGFCISGILVIVESWLNEKATNVTRGVVMSTYVIITYVTITIGQLIITTMPVTNFALFSFCSIMLSLAAVPVALTRASQPVAIPVVRFRPHLLFSVAPAAFAGTFTSGVMTGSLFSLGAIYAVDVGFTKNEAAIFVSAAMVGGALGQYPFGRVSDFVDRRIVILVAVVATAAASFLLTFSDFMPAPLILVLGLVVGFTMLPIYSLAAAHAFDWTEPDNMVETSSALILLYGIGSTVGPLLSAFAMDIFGPGGLFLVMAIAAIGLAVFIMVRVLTRERPDEEMRSDFDIFSTAPVGGALTPEPIPEDDPLLETPFFAPNPGETLPDEEASAETGDGDQTLEDAISEGDRRTHPLQKADADADSAENAKG